MPYTGYSLVRDKDGNVKFDNWNNIDTGFWRLLTEADKAYVLKQREAAKLSS
jgi:hypothetical protein